MFFSQPQLFLHARHFDAGIEGELSVAVCCGDPGKLVSLKARISFLRVKHVYDTILAPGTDSARAVRRNTTDPSEDTRTDSRFVTSAPGGTWKKILL